MTDENWKAAPGYPGYEVSSRGQVRGLEGISLQGRALPLRMLTLLNHPKGYKMVSLQLDGRSKKVLVHRLVCEAFHGPAPSPEITDVCHIDEIKEHNTPENLKWGTRRENIQQYADSGRYQNQNTQLTHCLNGHPFSEGNTRRWTSKLGRNHRICRTCTRDRARERRKNARSKS